jgi:hypothetical protein
MSAALINKNDLPGYSLLATATVTAHRENDNIS